MKTIKSTLLAFIFIITLLSCNIQNKETNFNDLVFKWNSAISSQNIEKLSSMYDNTILYYNVNKTKNDCISDKLDFYKKNGSFSQEILGEITIKKTEDKVKCEFIKRVNSNDKTNEYSSYLIFRKINNQWKIISESDLISDNSSKIIVDNGQKKALKSSVAKKIKDVKTINGNIFIIYNSGTQKQITFNGNDENPIYLGKNILFIRNIKESGVNQTYIRKKIMLVSVDDFTEKLVTDKKPFKDGLDDSYEIFNIINPTLSLDKNHLYFCVERWVTESMIVEVNIKTGKWTGLFSGNYFEFIRNGKYKGYFLIGRAEIRDKGREIYYMIVDKNGNMKKEFKDKKNADEFIKMVK